MEFTTQLITELRKRNHFLDYNKFRWVLMENKEDTYSYLNRYGDVITYKDYKFTFEEARFTRVDALMEIIRCNTIYYNSPPPETMMQLQFEF